MRTNVGSNHFWALSQRYPKTPIGKRKNEPTNLRFVGIFFSAHGHSLQSGGAEERKTRA